MTSPAQPPAGWYADPYGLPALRWWDGREWTSHVQPGAAATPPVVPAAAPAGSPLPGAHTVSPAEPALTAPSVTAPAGASRTAPAPAFAMQPVDAVPARPGGRPTPATPAPAATGVTAPGNRAVLVGAISLLINPLLLCSIYAITLGVRGLGESRQRGMLAVALGAGGVATHALLAVLLVVLL